MQTFQNEPLLVMFQRRAQKPAAAVWQKVNNGMMKYENTQSYSIILSIKPLKEGGSKW